MSIRVNKNIGEYISMRNIIFFTLCLVTAINVHAKAPSDKINAVWLWGSTIFEVSEYTVIQTLTDNYVNEVYLLVKGGSGTIPDSSRLAHFITAAHKVNIKVSFWYIAGGDDKFLDAHPDAHLYHCPKPSVGCESSYPDSGENVNWLYPGYKEYVLNNISYFLNNFDPDGIHLDVIRFTNLTYSFDKYSLEKAESLGINTKRLLNFFKENYDLYAPKGGVVNSGLVKLYKEGDADVTGWVNMRKNIIYDYIKSIKDLMGKYKPGLPLTAAFMPEAALDPEMADVYYAQSYSLNSPLLDAIAPMAYFKSFDETPAWHKDITAGAIKQVSPNCKIINGVQTFDGITPEQLKEEITSSWDGGAAGTVTFRFGTTSKEQWEVIRNLYKYKK
jgi:uncharacterized lipoprotein YddW (UPF0748 family)